MRKPDPAPGTFLLRFSGKARKPKVI